MSKFKVGDKVVRTAASNTDVVQGGIYTVSSVRYDYSHILLCGLDDEYYPGYFELYEEPKAEVKPQQPKKKQPHTHAELIKAWADGAEIEYLSKHSNEWYTALDNNPSWMLNTQYRIKPEVKPDVTKVVTVVTDKNFCNTKKVELVFNPEMTEIKSVKIVDVVSD